VPSVVKEEAALNTLLPIAAAQQTAPPSTAAGIEADLKSGMFSEDGGPAVNKVEYKCQS